MAATKRKERSDLQEKGPLEATGGGQEIQDKVQPLGRRLQRSGGGRKRYLGLQLADGVSAPALSQRRCVSLVLPFLSGASVPSSAGDTRGLDGWLCDSQSVSLVAH